MLEKINQRTFTVLVQFLMNSSNHSLMSVELLEDVSTFRHSVLEVRSED